MKKLLLVSVLLFSFSATLFSQTNYKPGYVVTKTNDTIQGYINKNWAVNPSQISFKKELNAEPKTYEPKNLKSFFVDGQNYVSATVSVLTDVRNLLDSMGDNPTPKLKTVTTFLTVLVNGTKSLYYYNNNQNISSFYIKSAGKYQLLIYKKFYLTIHEIRNDIKSLTANKKYIGHLIVYLKDCPSIKSKIESTDYRKNQLITLFDKYYKCSGSKPSNAEKTTKAKYKFGFFAGTQLNDLHFKSNQYYDILQTKFSAKPGFTLGAVLDIYLPINYQKYILHNELGYSHYTNTSSYSSFLDSVDYKYSNYKFGTGQIFLNSLLRFNFRPTPSTFFLNAGFSLTYILTNTNSLVTRKRVFYEPSETITHEKIISNLKNFELGYILGFGYKHKQFSGEIRYTILPQITKRSPYQLAVRTFSIQLAYQLK